MVKITFQTIWKPPKSRNVKLLVLGTIPELSSIALHKVYWVESFQRGFECVWNEFTEKLENPYKIDFDEDDDEFTLEEYLELQKLSKPELVERFLEKRFEVMESDPDDLRVENIWQSRPVSVRSLNAGQQFSYIYMSWNCETNKMWMCEKFPEARKIEIPKKSIVPIEEHYVAYSSGFDTKQGETFHKIKSPSTVESRGGPAMSDDDYDA